MKRAIVVFSAVFLALLAPLAHAQYTIGYSDVETDGTTLWAWSEFDASSLPAYVQVCHGNGYGPPNCTNYASYASSSISLHNPAGTTVSQTQAGLTYLEAEVSLPFTLGGVFNSSGTNSYSCAGGLATSIIDWQVEFAYTLLKMRPVQVPPSGTCTTNNNVTECEYDTMTWCTDATTPPDNAPLGVRRVFPAEYPTVWGVYSLCERPGPGFAWLCAPGLTGNGTPGDYPRQACTKTP